MGPRAGPEVGSPAGSEANSMEGRGETKDVSPGDAGVPWLSATGSIPLLAFGAVSARLSRSLLLPVAAGTLTDTAGDPLYREPCRQAG